MSSASRRVSECRRQRKRKLVEAFGGKCKICSYDKYNGALQFHHKDPTTKEFGLGRGLTISWERAMAEALKCILVCANCHAEIEAGLHSEVTQSAE